MSKTIGQLKTTITSRLHGTTLNKIGDFYTLCRDTAEMVINRLDLQETTRSTQLVNPVYDKVYDYALPSDFKAPVDLAKQGSNENNDSLMRTFSRQFANQKKDNQFAIVWRNAIQFIRFARYLRSPITIDKADSLTENGTWTIGGNASNLTLDTLNYVSGIGSIKATISNSGLVQNFILNIGNDSSNYYTKTVTAGHFEDFIDGWNLLNFTLSGATLVGTVDMTTIKYVKVLVTYNSGQTAYYEKTLTNVIDLSGNYLSDGAIFCYVSLGTKTSLSTLRLDNITAHLGTLFNIDYYSNFLFRTSAGTWIEEPTVDTDLLNLSPISYKIFEAEMSRMITQQIQGAMGAFDFNYWDSVLEDRGEKEGLYSQYQRMYPSERIDGEVDYYNFTDDFDIDDNSDTNGFGWSPNDN